MEYIATATSIITASTALYYFIQNKRLRKTLGRYTDIKIAQNAPNIEISGKVEHVSLMFIDISSFTTLSEQYKPAFISSVVNIFFTTVCKNKGNGKIVKFIGDAVLLMYDINEDAVKAGITLTSSIERAFKTIKNENIKATIGIHSGDAYVGTIGNAERADFTSIGDAVNVASRVQSLCAVYNEPILISGNTMKGARDYMNIMYLLDTVKVKGREKAIEIYAMPHKNIELYKNALAFYRSSLFDEAKTIFETLKTLEPHNYVYSMWIRRCDKYKAAAAEGWDGVYTMSEK